MIKLDSNYFIKNSDIKDSDLCNFNISFIINKEKILSNNISDIFIFTIDDPLFNINCGITSENDFNQFNINYNITSENDFDQLNINFEYNLSVHRYEILAFVIIIAYRNDKKIFLMYAIDNILSSKNNKLISVNCDESIIGIYLSDKQFFYNGSNYKLMKNKTNNKCIRGDR